MNAEVDFDKRISVLEKSMEWAQGSIQKIDRDLDIIKNSQFQMLERLMDYKSDMEERIASLQSHTDERISSLQAHNDDKFLHVGEKFVAVHAQFADVHKEISGIHKAITVQTKWLLGMMLASATIISILMPIMQNFVK